MSGLMLMHPYIGPIRTSFVDNFPGTAGADFSSPYWTIRDAIDGSDTFKHQSGGAVLSHVAGVDANVILSSTFRTLSDTFQFDLDFSRSNTSIADRLAVGIGVQKLDYTGHYGVQTHIWGSTAHQVCETVNGWWSWGSYSTTSNNANYRLRVQRNSATGWQCAYSVDGGAWSGNWTETLDLGSGPFRIHLYFRAETTFPSINITFKSVTMNYGTIQLA